SFPEIALTVGQTACFGSCAEAAWPQVDPHSIFSARLTPLVTELEADKLGRTEADIGHALGHVDRSIETYIARCRERIPSFVDSHFSLEHTWALQKRTL